MNDHLNDIPTLGIVIPCFNEEKVLPETLKQIAALLDECIAAKLCTKNSKMWFVDDGSTDLTWPLIKQASCECSYIKGIKLAGNRGHQMALMAGLDEAQGDVLISIDADLQDDIQVIKKMLEKYLQGYDIVYGARSKRNTDTMFKRFTAEGYYKLLDKMGVDVVFNHADYRLLSRTALTALEQYQERNLFLRGVVTQLGLPATVVSYERSKRFAGESKYPLTKMLSLAFNGITSFSLTPLRIISSLGFIIFLVSMVLSAWTLYVKLFTDNAIPGWASSVLPIYLIGGVQLLCLGMIGEYVGKIYIETKKRPRYIIQEKT